MLKKIKKYFTDKPKKDFWRDAFITLFLFRYVTPSSLLIMTPFRVGLIAPESNVNYTAISDKVATGLVGPMQTLNDAGANIGMQNPVIANIIEGVLGYVVYLIYIMMFFLIINLARYLVSWIYTKLSSNRNNTSTEAKK